MPPAKMFLRRITRQAWCGSSFHPVHCRHLSVTQYFRAYPQHHASREAVLDLAGRQKQKLLHLGLQEVPFALVTSNSIACAATLRAAADLRCFVVLLPNALLTPLAVRHAGIRCSLSHDAGGELVVLEEHSSAADQGCQWPSSMSSQGGNASGACIVATSGSGQLGPKLVIYRWDACELQARVTAERTLRDATPRGGRVRFIAASNVGHAYNLNGMFSALEANAELCVPRDPKELAQTLSTPPAEDVEATVLFASPLMYRMLLQHEDVASGKLSKLLSNQKSCLHSFSAGCPLPAASREELRRELGIHVLQNYGSSETGNISLEDLAPSHAKFSEPGCVGIPWGRVELRPAKGGRLLPEGAEGEICVAVPWGSDGYLREGVLVAHEDAPFIRTGDAGRWSTSTASSGLRTLVVMQRLRPPIIVERGALRLQLQPYEVEAAILAANPSVTAAAALQGPNSTLYCAVEGASSPCLIDGPVQADKLVRLDQMPVSPAGKVLYSKIAGLFE